MDDINLPFSNIGEKVIVTLFIFTRIHLIYALTTPASLMCHVFVWRVRVHSINHD